MSSVFYIFIFAVVDSTNKLLGWNYKLFGLLVTRTNKDGAKRNLSYYSTNLNTATTIIVIIPLVAATKR
ncbi:MAG TPA: hypothetical protein VL442_09420 [Mucilaginibacter sp.]|jgi:hypothetical protein|nr:hypothetical protein [Mucilaginibacter sp.]